MRKLIFISSLFSASFSTAFAETVKMVDGRLVRAAEIEREANYAPPPQPAAIMSWSVQAWEVRQEEAPPSETPQEQYIKEASANSETLAEKLSRISGEKLKALEEKPAKTAEPEQISEVLPAKASYGQAPTVMPVPTTVISEAATVNEAEVDELISEHAKLLAEIRRRQDRRASNNAVSLGQEPIPAVGEAIVQTDVFPLAEAASAEPEVAMESIAPTAAAEKVVSADDIIIEREKAQRELKERLESDIKTADGIQSQEKPAAIELPNYYSYKGRCFEVLSSNYDARDLGVSVVKNIEETFANYFGSDLAFPRPVLLHMLLESEADFKGNFFVSDGENIIISVKCGKDLPLDKFCELAADAYLNALMRALPNSQKRVPYWLSIGLKAALSQKFAMGMNYDMARFASENPPDALSDVFSYTSDSPENFEQKESSAYWTLAALKVLSANQKAYEEMMLGLLSGIDPEKLLEPSKERYGTSFALQMRAILTGEVHSRMGGVKNLTDSDNEAVYFFAVLKERESDTPEAILGMDIFNRGDEVKNHIQRRIVEIKLALPWINPVYYNVLVSLGKMYEAALDEDEKGFAAASSSSVAELQNARAVSARILRLIKE